MTKDYYKVLGVAKSASQDEIKKTFRKLAHQHHPDKSGGDDKKFKEINEAYQILSNPQKRQQYDQFGQTFENARSQGGFSGSGNYSNFSDFASAFGNGGGQNGFSFDFGSGDLGDIFGDLFGFGGNRSKTRTRTKVGADIEVVLTIDFKEAVFGAEKLVVLDKDDMCSKCDGSGIEPGSKMSTCPECKGSGQVVKNVGFGIGFSSVCPTCGGRGQKADKDCNNCHGKGTERKKKELKIKIPAGIDNGQIIRLSGEGQSSGKTSGSGDLYVQVKVLPDNEFKREGYDVLTSADISFSQAALGDKININTLDGYVKLKIPEGIQSGKIFRIKGKGIPHLNSKGRGDQLTKVIIKTPMHLNKKQKELFRELQQEDA